MEIAEIPRVTVPALPDVAPAEGRFPALSSVRVVRIEDGRQSFCDDVVAEEVPVALVYTAISRAVMLGTPLQLDDMAVGFSLTEAIVAAPGEILDLEIVEGCQGIEVRMEISSRRFAALKDRRRNLAGRTGCGLCGVESLQAVAAVPRLAVAGAPLVPDAIALGLERLRQHQHLRDATGGTHATAWVDHAGEIRVLREDVGRHNALDKLIGSLMCHGFDATAGFVLTSSRASYEMVQKTMAAGIGCLVAVSAPTGMAVRLAEECGLTLAGFARGHRLVVYSGLSRLSPLSPVSEKLDGQAPGAA